MKTLPTGPFLFSFSFSRPNARVVFDASKTLHLVAKRDIAPGEEITITYCSPLLSTEERQETLLKNKFFACACPR